LTQETNALAYTDKASEVMNKIFTISAQDRKSLRETEKNTQAYFDGACGIYENE
jgi:hypothetical protein